jgi:hypothetical protein
MMSQAQSEQAQAEKDRLLALVRQVFRGGLAATIAAVVWLGIGLRVAMRVSALLNPDARGVLTENENVVGEITADGTIGLVVFVGVFGGFVLGLCWVIVREWLPGEGVQRAVLAGGLVAIVGGPAVVVANNPDFQLLDPPLLHIVMFVALFGLAGATTALLDDRLEGRLPAGETASAIFGGLSGLALVLAVPLFFFSFFLDGDWFTGFAMIAVGVATVAGWARYYSVGETGLRPRPVWQRRLGSGGLALVGLFGAVHLASQVESIL